MAALMIFGMATQAQAVVERIAPASSQLICFSSFCNDNGTYFDGTFPDPFSKKYTYESAQAWCSFATWTYSDRPPEGRFLAFYTCGNFAFALISASCPIPTNNPGARYTLNTSSGMCEREVTSCPSHASGSPCVCDAGYKFDAAGTSCVPEQYTIALHNLGGEINTSASRAAYAQVMEGVAAKSGIAVTLTTSALPGAGTAILSPTAGSTGADGRLNFTFTAPPVGGTHTVTATCDGGKCSNQATETVAVTSCPVKDLTPLAELSRLAGETPEQWQLTQQLENGMNAYDLLSEATQAAEQCLAGRIRATTVNYSVPTSTIRTLAYQWHFREVWDKFIDLQGKVRRDPTIQQTCQPLITTVEGEIGFQLNQDPTNDDEACVAPGRRHCLRHRPAGGVNPRHTQNIAFDIPTGTVNTFERRLRQQRPRRTVQQEANTCNLDWGGAIFKRPDRVHFQMRLN